MSKQLSRSAAKNATDNSASEPLAPEIEGYSPELVAGLLRLGIPAESLRFSISTDDFVSDDAAPAGTGDGTVEPLRRRWVKLPNGGFLPSDRLIYLFDNAYCDPGRTAMWRRHNGKNGPAFTRITKPSGLPRLHEILRPAGTSDRNPRDETIYQISWSDRDDVGILEVTAAALHDGSCWERWAGLGIEKRPDINFYARVVQLQAQIFGIPNRQLPRHTGWIKWPGARAYEFILPTGHAVTCDGVIESQISGYKFGRIREWRGFVPPTKVPDESAISGLFGDLHEIDKKGRISLMAAFAARSLVSEFDPVQTVLFAIGERRSGKTSAANFARGILGPCAPGPKGGKPDVGFHDTTVSIERALEPLHDMLVLLDDARRRTGGGHSDLAEMGRTNDRLISAAYNQAPIRQRGAYKGGLQQSVYVRCGLIITGEESVRGHVDESRLLRSIVSLFALGEIDHVGFRADWRRRQATLTECGYGIIRSIQHGLQAGTTSDRLGEEIAEAEEIFAHWVVESARAAAITLPDEDLWSMAGSIATPMTGALLIDRACGSEAAVNAIASYILPTLVAQARFIQGGGGSGIDRDFVAGAIRWLFSRHGGYLRGLENGPFETAIERGYAPDRSGSAGAVLRIGNRLAGKWQDERDCLLSDVFFDASQDYAQHLGRDFLYTPQTYPRALAQLELLEGQGDRNSVRARIDGELERVLRFKSFFPGNSGNSGNTHTFSPQYQEVTPFPLPDFKGLLSSIAGTDFGSKYQLITTPVPAVPAVSGEHGYIAMNDPGEPPAWFDDMRPPENDCERPLQPAPEPTTEPKSDLPCDDGTAENHAPAGSGDAAAAITDVSTPGEMGGQKNSPATQGKKPASRKAGAIKLPPGILVLEAEATWLGTDTVAAIEALAPVQREKRRKRPMPIEAVLDRARERGAEQIVLHRTWTAAASLPQIFQRGDAASPYLPSGGIAHSWAIIAPGSAWTLTHPGRLLSSIWARHKGGGAPIEILIPQYAQTAWSAAPDGETLVHALVAYRNSTASNGRAGFGHRNSGGNTFVREWRALTRDRGAADVATDLVPSAYSGPAHAVPEPVADLAYSRLPVGAEANASSCVVIDGNSQYLRVLDINCGGGSIEHLSGAAAAGESFKRPGWWRVRYRLPQGWPNTLPVPGWPLAPGEDGWLVSETLSFLADPQMGGGAEIEIFEAHLWSRSTRALARLQHRLRDGRLYLIERSQDASLMPAERAGAGLALNAAKASYKAGIGWFSRVANRQKTEVVDYHRPHWRHAIIARSTAAILRDVFRVYQRTGLTPIAIAVDGLGYMTDLPADQLAAHLGLPIGLGLGEYKHSRVVPGASMLQALAANDGSALSLITGTRDADDGADA